MHLTLFLIVAASSKHLKCPPPISPLTTYLATKHFTYPCMQSLRVGHHSKRSRHNAQRTNWNQGNALCQPWCQPSHIHRYGWDCRSAANPTLSSTPSRRCRMTRPRWGLWVTTISSPKTATHHPSGLTHSLALIIRIICRRTI